MKMFALDESRSCLSDYSVALMRSKAIASGIKKCKAIVRYQTGEEKERVLAEIWVAIGKRGKKMWADVVTGSLFSKDGECRSSSRVQIVRWV